MSQKKVLLRIKEIRLMQFGCNRPGGRPLSESRASEIEKAGGQTCTVKAKDGRELRYRKQGEKTDAETRETARLGRQEKKLGEKREGTKAHTILRERIQRTRARIAQIKKKRDEIMRTVDEIPTEQIDFDPKRFQYKLLGAYTSTGEVGSLEGIRSYDPNLAGILQVWKDPADGKIYVVNGHNRLALAKRAGAEKVAVRFLQVGSDREARAIGALTNIAEGRGSSLDSAKFFRDSGISRDDLAKKGIQLRDSIAREGLALAALPKVLFNQVIDGELDQKQAVAIGETGFGEQKMYRLYEMVRRQEDKGRAIKDDTIRELAGLISSSETEAKTSTDLFGDVEEEEDSYIERAGLQDMIKRRLGKEKRVFGVAARAGEMLGRAGNVIDIDKSLETSKAANEHLRVFDEFKTDGDLNKTLNEGARKMKNAPSRKAREMIENEVYESIVSAIPKFVSMLGVQK